MEPNLYEETLNFWEAEVEQKGGPDWGAYRMMIEEYYASA